MNGCRFVRKFIGVVLFSFQLVAAQVQQQGTAPSASSNLPKQSEPAAPTSNSTAPPGSKPPDLLDILEKQNRQAYTPKGDEASGTQAHPLEDWVNLRVPPGLTGDALSLDLSTFPEFTKEVVRAEWRLGDDIELWIIKPVGVKNPPVILYLYSFPTTNDRYHQNDFCKFLVQKGFAAVGFVSALTGQRYGARPQKEWFVSELQEALAVSVHDVQLVLNYLNTRGDIDMTRVGMFGDGSGASIALMAAAVDPRIKVVDLLDPWGDWPEWLAKSGLVPEDERPNYIKPEFLQKVQQPDPVNWFPQLSDRRVRLQLIDGLKVTPKTVEDRIESAAPKNVEIVHYANTEDFLRKVAATGQGFDWIKQQLSSLAASPNDARKDSRHQ